MNFRAKPFADEGCLSGIRSKRFESSARDGHTWRILGDPQVGDGAILDQLGLQIGDGYLGVKIPDICHTEGEKTPNTRRARLYLV